MNLIFFALISLENNNVQQQNLLNTGLRGYHVYRTSCRKPFLKQQLTFKQEKDNKHDRFAVAWQTILPGTIFPSTAVHIPIELSRYVWHALQREAVIKGEVTAINYNLSPLVQGGLEIPIAVTVKWDDKNAIDILRKKVEEVSYPLGEDDRYTDESKDILNLILKDDASTDSDGDVEQL